MSWRIPFRILFSSAPVVSMYFGLTITASYVTFKDFLRFRRIISTYKSGNILSPYKDNIFEISYQSRPREEEELRSLLSNSFTNEYYFIHGEVGVGKTRTILEVIRRMINEDGSKKKGAPIYVSVHQGRSFSDILAEAVNFQFDEHLSFRSFFNIVWGIQSVPKKDELSKIARVLRIIEETSFIYLLETGRPVVLVIDGVDTLRSNAPEILSVLHRKAKIWADTNTVKMIFINNDADLINKLQASASNWSRSGYCPVIDDLTREEATEFLLAADFIENDNCKDQPCVELPFEVVKKAVDLVGGRILDLVAFKREFRKGASVEQVSERLKDRVREKFIGVSQAPSTWKVVSAIRSSRNRGVDLSRLIKQTSRDDVTHLLNLNIIRYTRDGVKTQVRFASTLTENVVNELEIKYVEEKAAMKEGVRT